MIRSLYSLLIRLSRWLGSLFKVERPVMRCPYYHVIDTRMPRYEIVDGEWVLVVPPKETPPPHDTSRF